MPNTLLSYFGKKGEPKPTPPKVKKDSKNPSTSEPSSEADMVIAKTPQKASAPSQVDGNGKEANANDANNNDDDNNGNDRKILNDASSNDEEDEEDAIAPPSGEKKRKRARVIDDDDEDDSDDDNNDSNDNNDNNDNSGINGGDGKKNENGGKINDDKKMEVVDTSQSSSSASSPQKKNKKRNDKKEETAKSSPAKKKAKVTSFFKPSGTDNNDDNNDDDDDDDDDDEGDDDDDFIDDENDNDGDEKAGKVAKKKAKKGKSETTPVDEDAYDPSAAEWSNESPVPFSAFADVLDAIDATTKRLEITRILRDFLRSVMVKTPEDFLPCFYLATNKLGPSYTKNNSNTGTADSDGVSELGIGDALLIKAIAESCGRSLRSIKDDLEYSGDLGTVAANSRSTQRTMFAQKPLTVRKVFGELRNIAKMSGNTVQKKKIDKIKIMLVAAKGNEPRFIIRLLQGKLRIGLAESTAVVSLAHAIKYTPVHREPLVLDASKGRGLDCAPWQDELNKAVEVLKDVYSQLPNFDMIVPVLLKHGIEGLPSRCFLQPGIPVKPMLAKPTNGLQEILTRFNDVKFTCEYKYDGERAQIHRTEDGTVHIYSRNLECNTTKYPDVINLLPSAFLEGTKSFVLDSEVVAVDPSNGNILPFQVLSKRARKAVSEDEVKIQVAVYAFDLLFINGRSLLKEQFAVRRKLLHESFKEVPGKFTFATAMTSSDTEDIDRFLNEAIAGNCEGLMIKTLEDNATYEPSRRSLNWLKLKKDYLDGLTDSFDLVPIGAFHGKGKRTGVYGAFLLACYDPEEECYQSITKAGTGFSDEDLKTHTEFLKHHITDKPKSYFQVAESMQCDVWFEPAQVWEVKAADLSISPVHKAAQGKVDPAKGIALRFPRFIRIRDDKATEDATNADQIVEMYHNQKLNTVSGNKTGDATCIDDDEW